MQEQLVLHRERLAGYEAGRRHEDGFHGSGAVTRTVEHWRGVTLRMGLLYERAAVDFWAGVATDVSSADGVAAWARAEDDGAA